MTVQRLVWEAKQIHVRMLIEVVQQHQRECLALW
jgi:hypothetical protein